MLIEKRVVDYVNQVASKEPAPGGGSVSALVGSLGAALTSMVGNLTIGRKAYDKLDDSQKTIIDNNLKIVQDSITTLNEIVDEDTTSFNKLMAAFKMPKSTEEEISKRSQAIEEATKGALEVPLNCARECLKVLKLQKPFIQYGNPNAVTDIGVGALLAYSGLEGALFNVKINLMSLNDEEYVNKIESEIDSLMSEGNKLKGELLAMVYERL